MYLAHQYHSPATCYNHNIQKIFLCVFAMQQAEPDAIQLHTTKNETEFSVVLTLTALTYTSGSGTIATIARRNVKAKYVFNIENGYRE